jgi:hypothetical protein
MDLILTTNRDGRLGECMNKHYSQPRGFVGRNLCYAIVHDGIYYGHIVGGSATRFLPGRNEFFDMTIADLNLVINNVFFRIERYKEKYPYRNFVVDVVRRWREAVALDWYYQFGDKIVGYESLVEPPRTGEVYKRDGWELVGKTIGYSCKRIAGEGTDKWTGKRIWDTKNLRPKLVWVRKVDNINYSSIKKTMGLLFDSRS